MEVRDVLASTNSAVLAQVYADRPELITEDAGEQARCEDRRRRLLRSGVPDSDPMRARDDEQMTHVAGGSHKNAATVRST